MSRPDIQHSWRQQAIAHTPTELMSFFEKFPDSLTLGSTHHKDEQSFVFTAYPERSYETPELAQFELEQVIATIPRMPEHFIKPIFCLGVAGLLTYDFGVKRMFHIADDDSLAKCDPLPLHSISLYTWSLTYDKYSSKSYLTFSPLCSEDIEKKVLDIFSTPPKKSTPTKSEHLNEHQWKKSWTKSEYNAALKAVKAYILNGDCYQANLTQRFETVSRLKALEIYWSQVKKTPSPFSSCLKINEDQAVISFSPEQFIHINDGVVTTKPIKGTAPRNENLRESPKNQAENLMIVDLMRNDLSQFSELGTVKVEKLFELEEHPNLQHLVSTVSGQLKADISPIEALLAAFPGGSITGAPKKRSMEIIKELEQQDRSAYCGTLFYWDHSGRLDSNILIRTIVKNGDTLYCWGGGGIVSDSDAESEYAESLNKVKHLTGISE